MNNPTEKDEFFRRLLFQFAKTVPKDLGSEYSKGFHFALIHVRQFIKDSSKEQEAETEAEATFKSR